MDSIFTQTRYVEAYMWGGAAAMFSDEGQISVLLDRTCWDHWLPTRHLPCLMLMVQAVTRGMRFVLGVYYPPDNLGPFGNNYKNLYKIIRKCNTILTRIDEVPEMSASDRINILGYTRFIRAYAYNKLLMEFGPPIILEMR